MSRGATQPDCDAAAETASLSSVRAVRARTVGEHGPGSVSSTRKRSCSLWNRAPPAQNAVGSCMTSSEREGCGDTRGGMRHSRARAILGRCQDENEQEKSCKMSSRQSDPAVSTARSRNAPLPYCLQRRVPGLILGVAMSLLLAPSAAAEGNLGSKYPLWGAGSNRNGALNSQINVGVTVPNSIPAQVLTSSDIGQGNEVISVAVGNTHVIAQSVSESEGGCDQVPAFTVPRKTWTWGVNKYGQLGRQDGVGSSQAVESGLLARSYFPKRKLGNEISADEGTILGYSVWRTGGQVDFRNITVTAGVKGLHGLEQEINSLIGEDVISLTTDPDTEKVVVAVVKTGYQISFYGGKPIAESLGFLQPFRCPSEGLLNEISVARDNNLLVWSHHEGAIRIRQADGNNIFRFKYWDDVNKQVSERELDIPDEDYTPYELSQALNNLVTALGLPSDLFDIGPQNLALPGTPTLTWRHAGHVFDFARSFVSDPQPPQDHRDLLGFYSSQPSSDLFAGDLPNEVSYNARTNLFHYGYTDASLGWVMQNYSFDLFPNDPGIYSIDGVMVAIENGMNERGHPGVLNLYTDSDSRVVLEVVQAGFQIRLNKDNTIGKYLGFDSVVIPCDPSDSGCPLASSDVTCVTYGGCVTATASIQARADSSRPFMTRTKVASGICSSGFICACDVESSASTTICYDTSGAQMSNASASSGGCSCGSRDSFLTETAMRSWGGFKRYEVIFPDGVYTLAAFNQALLAEAPSRFRELVFLVFQAHRSDGVATMVLQMENIQVNFDMSTVTALLGFNSVSIPSDFTQPAVFYQVDGALPTTLITELEQKVASEAGEWIVQVAAGTDHTLVQTLNPDTGSKRLWAFGSNRYGQLGFSEGNGTDAAFEVPRLIPSVGSFYPNTARAVYAGGDHSAVVDVGGKVWMFGRNSDGQLGVDLGGAQWTAEPVLLPRSAFGNATDLSLALGRTHTLLAGIINGNETALFSFGNSNNGKLGRSGDATMPGAVDFTLGIDQMCAGGEHSLLLTKDGRIWGTGLNDDGQVGVAGLQTQTDVTSTFILVGTSFFGTDTGFVWEDPFQGSAVTSIACGQQHSVALTKDGSIWVFGSNSEGQLMNDENLDLGNSNPIPKRVDDSSFLFNTEVTSAQATACSVGGGDFATFVQTKRTFCLVGQFSADGLQPCQYCPAGKYNPNNESTTCLECAIGSYTSQVGSAECAPCPKDSYANMTGQDQCFSCPEGVPGTVGTGAISVDNCTQLCQPGTFSDNNGVPPCDGCPAGSYAPERQATGCIPCEIGSYQPSNGSSACIPCPGENSTADVGANSSAACLEVCNAGESGVNGLAGCTACGLGTFSDSPRSSSCTRCPQDTFANSTGQSTCFACPAHFGTAGDGKDTIAACERECVAGQYSSNFGLEPCLPCPEGNYSDAEGSVVCQACDPGFFSGIGSTSCTTCPVGQYSSEYASPNCTVCDFGSFQDQTSQTACDLCEHSSFANSTGLSACIECAEGLFTRGVGTINADECVQLCSPGTASESGLKGEGAVPCDQCPNGQEPFNSTATVAVEEGVGVFGGRGCRDCEPGFFAQAGFGVCTPCPSGTFSNTSQTSTCTDCPLGQFSYPNATVCGVCAPGSFAGVPGTGNCSLCEGGSYQNASGQSTCELCNPGWYAPRRGTVVGCQTCPQGKFSASAGASTCDACAPGFFSGESAQSCTPCVPGTFADASGTYVCKNCSVGTYAGVENSTTCLPCNSGEAAKPGSSSCETCEQGKYSDGTLATCALCPAGPPATSTSSTGSSSISDCKTICPAGTNGTDGLAPCTLCAAGRYASSIRSSSCDACPTGAFSDTGATICNLCLSGKYVNADNTDCVLCDPGYFAGRDPLPMGPPGLDPLGATECDPCPKGYFARDPGSDRCLPCDLGFYAETIGTAMCDECPFGTSTANTASVSPNDCDQDCEPGKANPDSNGISRAGSPCVECAPGFYAPYNKQVNCFACPAGKFQNVSGQTYCIDCPYNTYNDTEGATTCSACPNTPLGETTYTLNEGASTSSLCRLFDRSGCRAPRNFGVYPLYGAGSNEFGQTIDSSLVNNAQGDPILRQVIIKCNLLNGAEIVNSAGGGGHTIVQTAMMTGVEDSPRGRITTKQALWSFGRNNMGQLGATTASQSSRVPIRIPAFLFPSFSYGNLVSSSVGNNVFTYWAWNATASIRMKYDITIDEGYYGPADIMRKVSQISSARYGHPTGAFRLDVDPDTEALKLSVVNPGFQLDFTSGTLYQKFGVSPVLIPPNGTLNEVSRESQNQIFKYRLWCETWPACTSSTTVSIVLPDGVKSLLDIAGEINDQIFKNGHGVGPIIQFDTANDKVVMTIEPNNPEARMQIIMGENNNMASFLGFEPGNYPSWGPVNTSDAGMSFIATETRQWLNPFNFVDDARLYKPYEYGGDAHGQVAKAIELGADYSLVQTWDASETVSRLWSFGSNRHGQLGVESNSGTNTPNPVPMLVTGFDELNGGKQAIKFQASKTHTMVQASDKSLWAFGSNLFGQLGVDTNFEVDTPNWNPIRVRVQDFDDGIPSESGNPDKVDSFSLGFAHTLVRTVSNYSGDVKLWSFGSNHYGQLGTQRNSDVCKNPFAGQPTVSCLQLLKDEQPEIVPVGTWEAQILEKSLIDKTMMGPPTLTYSAAVAGANHSLVQASDGRMWCFGSNDAGECGNEYRAFDNVVYPSPTPILVGTKVLPVVGTLVSPSYECCALWDGNGAGCTAPYGYWPYYNGFEPCPFMGRKVQIYGAGDRHSILRSDDGKFWSFGENFYGQLLRMTNLANVNANPYVEEISRTNFGFGNQPLLTFKVGDDHSLIQTHRPYCRAGNHSTDKREPCYPCEPGSFTDVRGTLTSSNASFDQSVLHPHVTLYNVTYLSPPTYISCTACGAGNFSSLAGASVCGTCPAGTYAFQGASSCHQCEPGTVSSAMAGNCTLCSPGQSSVDPFTTCFNCPIGSYSGSSGSRACTLCAPGSFSNTPGSSTCTPCPFDYYQNETGATVCVLCPNDEKTSFTGSSDVADCSNLCTPGSFGTPVVPGGLGLEPCTLCPVGTAAPDRGQTYACPSCLAGNFSGGTGRSFCDACPAGTFSLDGASACTDCARGTFSLAGSSTCDDCLAGSYSLDRAGSCTLCETGKYNDLPVQSSCDQCIDGMFTNPGETVCRDCVPGEEGQGGLCFNCTPGFFSTTNRSLDCDPCAAGTFSGLRATVCTNCTPGFFNGELNGTACHPCVPGTFTDEFRTEVCELCNPGSTTSGYNATFCTPCEPGLYAPAAGSLNCSTCSEGTFSLANASVCTNCSAGTITSDPGLRNCTGCEPGYYAYRDGLSTCTECACGTYGNLTGMSICWDCSAGTVSQSNATACEQCIPGTFAENSAMCECEECAISSYAEGFGHIECTQCPLGKTTRGNGAGLFGRPNVVPEFFNEAEDCTDPCPAGYYSSWGIEPCLPCPGGYFNQDNFSYLCYPCSAGYSSNDGSTACTICPPGSVATAGQASCTLCPQGSFQPFEGQSACDLCAIGTYQDGTGRTQCETCPFRLAENTYDILYYRDCRANCSAEISAGNFSNISGSVNSSAFASTDCCNFAPVRSIEFPQGSNITNGEYSAAEIETLINDLVFADIGINQFVKIDIDELGWSYGDFEKKKWLLHLQYGGFQILFSSEPPRFCSDGSCIVGPGSVNPMSRRFERQVGTILGFIPESVMPFEEPTAFPAGGPTTCYFNELPTIDGGCYSRFEQYSNADPESLTTEATGTISRFQCEAYCIAGTFNPDGLDTQEDPCDDCNSGYYSDTEGATACLPCAPGSYTETSGAFTRCTSCEDGKFQNAPNATTCIDCPIGSFAPTRGQSVCDLCPPGTFSVVLNLTINAAPDTCVECNRGFYAGGSGGISCDTCESGTYSSSSAASSCVFCEPGRFSNASAATSCSICTAGYRSSDPYGSAFCTPCAAGTYSWDEASTCIDCEPGEFSDAMSSACTLCPAGFFSSAAGSPNCTACDPGSITDTEGQVACDDCPRGQYQNQSNATLCFECPGGTFAQSPGSPVCALCGWGEYSQNGSFVCDRCPRPPESPEFTNTTGVMKTSIMDCAQYCRPGTAGYNGVEPCISCYPGTTSLGTANPEPFSGFCNVESVYSMTFEGGGIQATVMVNGTCVESGLGPCDPCPPGQENPFVGKTGCTQCPVSTYAVGGNANCTKCPVNTVSEPGSTSEDDCQRFCLRGSFSLTTKQPCSPCPAGTFTDRIGQTACQICAQGKYQDEAVQSACLDCPAGMGTAGIGSYLLSNCTGVNEKLLVSGFCRADDVYFRAQGHLSQVEVITRGSGYAPGVLDILGGPGEGFHATFQTIGDAARVANVSVYDEGIGYTSSGRVELYFATFDSVAQASQLRAQAATQPQYNSGPPALRPTVPDFDDLWVRSHVPMRNSISVMEREVFTDLQTTPSSFLFGCLRGTIEVESTGGGAGFEATYTSTGTNLDICIGRMVGGVCHPGREQHGAGYSSLPRVRVVEHAVVAVRVRPNSQTQGCRDTSLAFSAADPRAGGLTGSITTTGGMIDSVTVLDGGSGFMEPPAVFPTDGNCTCGTGIGRVSVRATGAGYPAFTSGSLVVDGGDGTGFQGTFSTDLSGAISELVVTQAGSGYSAATVLRACPAPSVWDRTLVCCRYDFAVLLPEFELAGLAVDPGTLCLSPLTLAALTVHLGLPGTVPGAFDECLEAVVDPSTCRCGSEASNLTLLSGGAGYVPGKVLILSESCLASGLPACRLSNFPPDANFTVATAGMNGTYLEGEITSLDVRSGGSGYDQSSRVVFAYSETTRCDDGNGVEMNVCIQDGTISKVTVGGTVSIPVSLGGFPVARVGLAATICAPGQICSGSGFSGTCDLDAQNTISGISILNHGTGFDVAETPNITCSFAVNRTDNVSQYYVVKDAMSGTSMSLFVATVAGGGTGSLVVGKPSGVWGNHDDCLDMEWADGNAFLVAGPLHEVEVRLLGEVGSNESKRYGRLSFNEDTLKDERLTWFVQTAIGHDELYLIDSSCVVSEGVHPTFPGSGFWVHRSLECTGIGQCRGFACTDDSDIWGFKGNLSVVIVEISNSSRLKTPDVATQLHIALFQIATGVEQSWSPFQYNGIPLFDGTPEESWIRNLAFGAEQGGLPFDALVQASTTQFTHNHCSMCQKAPASFLRFAPFNGGDKNSTLSLRRGLAFNVENTHVPVGIDGRRRLLGLERIYKQIRDGTVRINLDGYLDIPGCLWPNTENIKWQIGFESEIIFLPFPSIVLFDRVSVMLGGIQQYEDLAHTFRAMVYLEENKPFEVSASLVSLRADQGSSRAPLRGFANSSTWTRPFGAQWLEFGDVHFRFEAHQYEGVEGVNVTTFTFETNGTARLLDDPWTEGGPGEVVAVSVKGNSGQEFPHIYCEIQMDVTTADPAAVIRTFVQEAMNLNYSNPVCGTTAGRDFAFTDTSLRFIYSTWEASQYQIPSQDVRSYNCITRNGTAFSGKPCHFPFEYNGQIFTECTTQDWDAPWCATTATYDGSWGECVCDKLRRGLYFTGDVRLSQDGPLNLGDIDNPQRLERINNILLPLMTPGQDITHLQGTLEVFFPWFDSSFSNDLELLVLFAPSSLDTCENANRTSPQAEVATAPSGECERLGFVTEWMGEPGDTSMIRCRPYRDQADSLLAAATQAMLVPPSTVPPRFPSISSPVELMQSCIEAGMVRELSLCAAEKFRFIPVADPSLFGRQFCFWTETSDTPGFQENKFATCSSCSGRSCTTENTPVLAWQLQDRVCLAHPC